MKADLLKLAFRWHRALVWVACGGMLVFVVSAFAHLLLTWTGPQTAISQPPQQVFDDKQLAAIPAILRRQNIQRAELVKLVPYAQQSLLQVTENRLIPRRYFDLQTGREMSGQDEQQARWLANYYLDDASRSIESLTFQSAFDDDYPWVNRLLPVYKVMYEGDDGLTLYIHTESLALASISNHWKDRIQGMFRQLHTFAWLESFRHGRVVLMVLLLGSLLAMISSGLCLLFALKRQQPLQGPRRWHRVVAYIVAIPLLGFTASGLYHLLQHEYGAAPRDFNLAQPLLLENLPLLPTTMDALTTAPLHSVALVRAGEQLWWRASMAEESPVATGEHDHHGASHSEHQVRQQRFEGIPKEQGGMYLSLEGATTEIDDERVARQLARDYLGITGEQIVAVEKVTHFGPDYDFRNKRLPVWKVQINNDVADVLFIDVASGLLVDRVNRSSRMEGYSFSFLHKWNFMTFPLGREKRDALIVLVLLGVLALVGLGIKMALRRPA